MAAIAEDAPAAPPDAVPVDGPSDQPVGERAIGLATVGALVATVAGLFIGLQPLRDNSFLTHLATGRLILDTGSVPTVDPYSFTAAGEPWTVQSWLASVLYAGAESIGGSLGIRLLVGVATALLAYLLWRLTEPASAVVARMGLLLPVLVIGAMTWSERPMLFGLLGLASVWLLADGHGRGWWAVPLFWAWVNTHGSFPLGLVLIGCLLVGRWLDRRPAGTELHLLGWAGLGVLAGGLNPIGPRLITFPVELLSKSEALSTIREWQPPVLGELETQLLILLTVVAAGLFLRRRTWRQVLPAVVFVGAAAMGARNIGPAALVLLAAVAPSLEGLGHDDGRSPHRLAAVAAAVIVAVAGAGLASSLSGPHTDLVGYPTTALAWMDDEGLLGPDARVVSRDFVGNYLEARHGTDVPVFMDDRYDMFPIEVIRDYRTLMEADEAWPEVLERWDADAVLWDLEADLGPVLAEDDRFEVVYRDDDWIVAVPH